MPIGPPIRGKAKPDRLEGVHWHEPEPQAQTVEVLHSNERPAITPLFGTTLPPAGMSGRMRRFAFRYSESDLRHWLLLLAADRVNMVEGLLDDWSRGQVPNVYAEMGGPAELRHNPLGVAKKALAVTAVVGIGYLLLRRGQAPHRTVLLRRGRLRR